MKNIILSIKHAYNIPTLPKKLNIFYEHIFTRIFRFLGGASVLITLIASQGALALEVFDLQNYLVSSLPNEIVTDIIIYSIFLLASLFIIFHIVINIIKIIYGIYLLRKKPEIFEIRNSPLNLFATQLAKLLYCLKVGCVATGSTAAIIAGGITFDTLIEKTGRAPIFIPLLAEGLNLILGEPTALNQIKLPRVAAVAEISENIDTTDYNQDSIKETLNNYKNLSVTEKEAFWKEVSKEFNKN